VETVLVAVLSLTRLRDRLAKFVTLYAMATLLTAALTTVVPAAGAYVHFDVVDGARSRRRIAVR